MRKLLATALLILPAFAFAQVSSSRPAEAPEPHWPPPNALTMQVIMAQRPPHIAPEQWKEIMLGPDRLLHPIRITPAMLDTLDARLLDRRYHYIMSHEQIMAPYGEVR
ncbi:MAG: hypothetical protein IPP83_00245 [Flavobacteriales bacterium]|nr:hypothetical protein [Flavobacteriales bacterium]